MMQNTVVGHFKVMPLLGSQIYVIRIFFEHGELPPGARYKLGSELADVLENKVLNTQTSVHNNKSGGERDLIVWIRIPSDRLGNISTILNLCEPVLLRFNLKISPVGTISTVPTVETAHL